MLSVVLPALSLDDDFFATLSSLEVLIAQSFEVLVVCPEEDHAHINSSFPIEFIKDPGVGVFTAINSGILRASGEWVMTLNSGDLLKSSPIETLDCVPDNIDILVFRQEVIESGVPVGITKGSDSSLWPHQSTLVRRRVYQKYGLYPERFQIVADQVFFALVRDLVVYAYDETVLTQYDLSGLSRGVHLSYSSELLILWLMLRRNLPNALLKAYVRPWIRFVVLKLISKRAAERLIASIRVYFGS